MGYVIRHSTGSINRARKKGKVAFGVSSKGYNKTSVSGLYNGVPPVAGKHNLVRVSSTDDPDFYALSNAELINFANQLGGSASSVSTAKTYLNGRDDIMFTDNIPDNTVANDLILDLDATNIASYPGSGNTWYDLSGNGNDTTCSTFNYNGSFFYSVGSSPGRLVFSTPHSTTLNNTFAVTSSGWTIEELVRIDDTTYPESSAGTVVSGKAYGSGDTGFDWQHGSMHLTQLNIDMSNKDTGGSNSRDAEVNISIDSQFRTYGRWYLRSIYWDRDNDTCGVYYNGIFQGSGSISGVSGYPLYDGGGISWGTLYGWQHDGARAAMRVYSKVLSETEVKQNHYGGNIVTDSLTFATDAGNLTSYESGSSTAYSISNPSSGSLINDPSFSFTKGGTWEFDGTNERIDFDGISILNDIGVTSGADNDVAYSMEAWIKLNDYPAGVGMSGDCIMGHNSSLGIGLQAFGDGSTYAFFNFGYRTNNNYNSGTININEWYHVVGTRELGGYIRIYINGAVDTALNGDLKVDYTTNTFNIGHSTSRIGAFNGDIAVTRIYSKALSADEVLQNYNAQKARFL